MKKYLLLFVICILTACEETINNLEFPYKEQLVILAVLEPGKPIEDILITKTLPPLEEFTMSKVLIKYLDTIEGAKAVVISDGVEYPLIFDNATDKYFVPNLIPEVGKTYSLFIRLKDMVVTAKTIIPEMVNIESFTCKQEKRESYDGNFEDVITLYANFKPIKNSVYSGIIVYENDQHNYLGEFLYRYSDTSKSGKINLPVTFWSGTGLDTNIFKKSMKYYNCILECYDYQFYNYFISRWEGNQPDFFSTSGINIQGNIMNGIGLFIGRSKVQKKVFFE